MKIELSSIVENQLPLYVREEYPLAAEFLKQYYFSDNANKIAQNIDEYLDLDVIFGIPENTVLTNSIDFDDDVINVSSTYGFPETYGLLKINDEIITYTSKTETSFDGCVRGFSGVERTHSSRLVFNQTQATFHNSEEKVYNLSSFFLKEFLFKTKKKIAPGFENREFYSKLNQSNFLKRLKDFYQSKGTAESFRLLFAALYGTDVKVLLPRDRLFSASNAQYRVTKKLVVEAIEGNPKELVNGTIYQDSDGFIPEARGTITYVEQIVRNNKNYFIISLDYDYNKDINVSGTLKSEFTIHPQTIILSDISINSTFIDVDSTVGFPDSGSLVVKKSNGEDLLINYSSKSLNQFLGCSNISVEIKKGAPVRLDSYAYGYNSDQEVVKFRVTGVLDKPDFVSENYSYNPGEEFDIETLGFPSLDLRANEWNFNIPLSYNISSIEVKDLGDFSYSVSTFDDCVFSVGDSCALIPPSQVEILGTVLNILNSKAVVVKFGSSVDLNKNYIIRKKITKTNFQDVPELSIYNANVQNTYIDSNKNVYVLSPSLPSYLNTDLTTNTGKVVIPSTFFTNQIIFEVPHPFFTGDSVVYRPESSTNKLFNEGIYFVKKINENTIKLALSRENLYQEIFIEFSGSASNGTLEFFEFTGLNLSPKTIQPQNLIRKLVTPRLSDQKIDTPLASVGILKNGVEIMNYKSPHQIFYGPITKIVAAAPGDDYDVITPPPLSVIDPVGSGASVYAAVTGSLKKIDLVFSGFDYLDEPFIEIKGGNGKNAIAKANLVEFEHIEFFNADTDVSLSNRTIGFTTYHKFRQGEEIIYNASNQSPLGGLVSNEKYFVHAKNGTQISLHLNKADAIVGVNSIVFSAKSFGLHNLKVVNKKQKIGSISVLNSGQNYKNRKNVIVGIVTSLGIIEAKDHKFNDGEKVYYHTPGSVSSGLTNNTEYYVTIIDKDRVKLSELNPSDPEDFYYKTKQYVGITSFSGSIQYLSYPPIEVAVKGKIGVATFDNTTFNAEIIPAFRGGVVDVTLESGGISYGSEDIMDYTIEPRVLPVKGSGAQLKPIINNGKITSVIIQYAGTNYTSTPDIIVSGDGFNAVLTPIIQNGLIIDVKIISGGFNYTTDKTFLTVVSPGEGAQFKTTIKSWRFNLFEKYSNSNYFSDDDGVILNALNPNSGLQYYHLFAPRKLRRSTYSKKIVDGTLIYEEDLKLDDSGKEISSNVHSPVIGWAYDGNPIYGPYGYETRFNSTKVKQLKSGYEVKNNVSLDVENRPTTYPVGFFVEDYEFTGTGDLDEHNGRYCSTPEFPNGVYAYFASFEDLVSVDGSFVNYKKPKFPYIIGNSFYSDPISFNFNPKSNQNQVTLDSLKVLRNTSPYNLKSKNTIYDGLIKPYEIKKGIFNVKTVSPSKIDKINVISRGEGYKVGEIIDLENENQARISQIEGKSVVSIANTEKIVKNIEIFTKNNEIIGYSSLPHDFIDNDLVFLSTYDGKNTKQKVKIEANQLILANGVSTSGITGIVTYLSVYGNISKDYIRPNDVYSLGQEQLKILGVDQLNSRIWVERDYNGFVGINSIQIGFSLTEKSRKVVFNNNIGINTIIINNEYYFNPVESVGIGSTYGAGIATTLYFSSPGAGITFLNVPTRTIYLPGHQLNTNDRLIYKNYGNQAISISTNGVSGSLLSNNSELYVAKFTEDLIGISSLPIGIGSTGSFVGVGSQANILYFLDPGNGEYHSFVTDFDTLNADLIKQEIVVSTASTHKLKINDDVSLSVVSGISTSIKIKYSDFHKRILAKETEIQAVDIKNNTIEFNNHEFKDGEKLVYNSNVQNISGLQNNGIYYAIVINQFRIKLAASKYNSERKISIDLQSIGDGTISSINPPLRLEKNSTVIFNLSDPSLGYVKNGFSYPAFSFDLYYDLDFNSKYFNNNKKTQLNFVKTGVVGVDSTANATLKIDTETPSPVYYNLSPINSDVPEIKYQKITDIDQVNYNTLYTEFSDLNQKFKVKRFTNNTITFDVKDLLQNNLYTSENSTISYSTNSKTDDGGIFDIQIVKNNSNNYNLPDILDIRTVGGKGAKLEVANNGIGSIKSIILNDIGFEYSTDLSVKPKLNLPKIIKAEPLYTIDKIEVVNTPVTYYTPPTLVLIDNFSNEALPNVILEYLPGQEKVNILKNTQEIVGTQPYIVPVNNSVGIAISNIVFNSNTKNVTVYLDAEFSDIEDFPFEVGKKVLIENVIVGEEERGYNSSIYNFALFEINNVDPNIGGIGATFSYSMENYLGVGEVLGTYDGTTLKGNAVPEKYLPTFNVFLTRNQFVLGENIFSNGSTGIIIDENPTNNYIKVLTKENLFIGNRLTGQTSKTTIVISDIVEFEGYLNIKSSSEVIDGWKSETGFFNNNLQRIHDNDYYQYFSYSLNSTIDFERWNEVVSDLVHPAGFKKFSDLIVYSETPDTGISTDSNSELVSINDIDINLNLNCIDNFDLVRENSILIDGELGSNEIYFDSVILQDYIESVGNRVLSIDEVSVDFSLQDSSFGFVSIDSFNSEKFYFKRYFLSVRDKWYPEKSNVIIANVLQNGNDAIITQYAELSSDTTLGYFDTSVSDNSIDLIYLPIDYEKSSYYIDSFSYGVGKNTLGVSSIPLGNVASIQYSGSIHNVGIGTTTIIGISSSVRSAKILVGVAYTDGSHYELDELSLVHDGTQIFLVNYGELVLSDNNNGIGTFNAYYSGDQIKIDLIPSNVGTGTEYYVNSVINSINNTSFNGIGTTSINNNVIDSSQNTTTSGISTEIFRYSNKNSGSYNIICIENTTTSSYSVLEFVSMYNPITDSSYYVSYGINETEQPLGIISSYVNNDNIIVEFKPSTSDSYSIRTINTLISTFQVEGNVAINTSFSFGSNYNYYESIRFGVKNNFELFHNNLPIFARTFDGSSSVGVSITENTIKIPNHFFVTGEEVDYSYSGSPIGIGTTFVIGIGTTTILPSKVYIVKLNDLNVRVAASASEALAPAPKTLDLISLGIGTEHTFTSTTQNNRCLITVDNVIQSPLVSTAKTTLLSNKIEFFDSKIRVDDSTDIISGDLLKIDDEIVKVLAIGIGTTNVVLVDRAKLGTGLTEHNQSTLVQKIKGNYNIIKNNLYYDPPEYVPNEEYLYSYTFGGRVFLRSGDINSLYKTYYDNYIFDDISDSFNGLSKSFKLTNGQEEVETTENRNAIVLINSIFQSPKFEYNITENLGISSIVFTGAATSVSYDINNASIPRGGIIISAGSTQGFGYQPLVSAGGTAIVSAAGTIQSISIGNSGSGYRSGLQTVRVGVQTESDSVPAIEFIGTATVSNGNVVSVAITNPGIGYTSYPVKYITTTSTSISVGSTIIPLDIVSGIDVSDYINVGTAITNAIITGIGSTAITIGSAYTSNTLISSATTCFIKSYNPPKVIFDSPLSYSNIPLIYANGSGGVEAKISIVVGQGSSVIDFEIQNDGYAYNIGDELTVEIGGSIGIPTDSTKPFIPFKIKVDEVFNDKFSSWVVGDLQALDPFDKFFNGIRRNFQLRLSNSPISIQKRKGSNIDLEYNLLIFINDVLQIPGESYTFKGGSIVRFLEPPAESDTSRVIFYRGTSQYDTIDVDIIEEVKIGDNVVINSEDLEYKENDRLVTEIVSTDTIDTYLYSGPGISKNEDLLRPITICRQTEDIIFNGTVIGKDRVIYEPIINPGTRLISDVSIGSTQIFVENVRVFFDNKDEYLETDTPQRVVKIISQDDNNLNYEIISNVYYDGDYGRVTGIKTTQIGIGSTGIVFQFYIPQDSPLRTESYVSNGVSGIKTGYYFNIDNSNISNGIISLNDNETQIGIGTTFIDNVYKAYSVSIAQTGVPGVGITDVIEVTAKVDRYVVGTGFSGYYGNYSWGRIHNIIRKNPEEFTLNVAGLSTSPIVQRVKALKYDNYYI